MTNSKPNKPSEPSLAREVARLRSSFAKLTDSQTTLLAYVAKLGDDLETLSGEVRRMLEAMRPDAAEDEARRQLH